MHPPLQCATGLNMYFMVQWLEIALIFRILPLSPYLEINYTLFFHFCQASETPASFPIH